MAAQPNFDALSQNLVDASAEISRIPNMPIIALQQQMGQILQRLDQIQAGQDLLPMQLQNTIASFNSALCYPANFAMPPQAPRTKLDMVSLSDSNCQIVANALNLPALVNPTIAQRRQQIIDFLGCGITV